MRLPAALLALLALLGAPALARGDGVAAPPAAPAAPVSAPASPLLLGEFPLADGGGVVDGDTIRVMKDGASTPVRILGLDAEETFHGRKGDAERQRAEADFDAYSKEMRGTSPLPVKYATPAGLAAREFALQFFAGVKTVRLERDEVGRDADGFGRLLMHVFAAKDGKERLFAEDLIQAGLSPYFVKYGRSKRYDARFAAATKEAQERKRGVFGDAVHHYPDYPQRLLWWEERAKQVDAWDAETAASPAAVARVRLGVAAETDRLPALLGKRVTLFASLDRVDDEGWPKRLLFVDKPHEPFAVVVFDEKAWAALDLPAIRARYSRIAGTLSEYRGHLQLKLESPADLSTR